MTHAESSVKPSSPSTAMDHSKHSGMKGMGQSSAPTPIAKERQHGHETTKEAISGDEISLRSQNELLNYDDLKSPITTQFPQAKVHEIKLKLQGNMRRYTWFINGKAIFQDRNVIINEGDIVRFTFVNETMMHHPMHLHGHFFRVLNKQGAYSPLKHTVDVAPSTEVKIEFLANEPGEWMLHCHNLYHLKAGMARVVKYSLYTPAPSIQKWQKSDPHNMDHWYFSGSAEVANIHGQGTLRALRTWSEIDARIESRRWNRRETEGDLFYRRWLTNYLNVLGGAIYFDESIKGAAGIGYLLPFLIESDAMIDHEGNVRLDLAKRFQWATHIFSDLSVTFRQKQKASGELSLMYGWNWNFSAGIKATEDEVGFGLVGRF